MNLKPKWGPQSKKRLHKEIAAFKVCAQSRWAPKQRGRRARLAAVKSKTEASERESAFLSPLSLSFSPCLFPFAKVNGKACCLLFACLLFSGFFCWRLWERKRGDCISTICGLTCHRPLFTSSVLVVCHPSFSASVFGQRTTVRATTPLKILQADKRVVFEERELTKLQRRRILA